MRRTQLSRYAAVGCWLVSMLALSSACEERSPVEKSTDRVGDKLEDVGDKMEDTLDEAGEE